MSASGNRDAVDVVDDVDNESPPRHLLMLQIPESGVEVHPPETVARGEVGDMLRHGLSLRRQGDGFFRVLLIPQ